MHIVNFGRISIHHSKRGDIPFLTSLYFSRLSSTQIITFIEVWLKDDFHCLSHPNNNKQHQFVWNDVIIPFAIEVALLFFMDDNLDYPKIWRIYSSLLILTHLLWLKLNCHIHKLKWFAKRHFASILGSGGHRMASYGDHPVSQKYWWWANQSGSFKTK